jgi:hypothetical protein
MNNSPEEGSALSPPAILSATSEVCSALDAIAASVAHLKAACPGRKGAPPLRPLDTDIWKHRVPRLRLTRQCGRPEHVAAHLSLRARLVLAAQAVRRGV